MDEVWDVAKRYQAALQETGTFDDRRAAQATRWMWAEVEENLLTALTQNSDAGALASKLEVAVAAGELPPAVAARQILDKFLSDRS